MSRSLRGCGSRIARRAVHTIALVSIELTHKGDANNSVLRNYYLSKCQSKPKMVALGAVVHKVCNIIFAIPFLAVLFFIHLFASLLTILSWTCIKLISYIIP